jgi:hypothetical protein
MSGHDNGNNGHEQNGNDTEQSPRLRSKAGPSFFMGVVGGIIVGAIFDNVGAGLAIGIALWLLGGLFEKKGEAGRRDP